MGASRAHTGCGEIACGPAPCLVVWPLQGTRPEGAVTNQHSNAPSVITNGLTVWPGKGGSRIGPGASLAKRALPKWMVRSPLLKLEVEVPGCSGPGRPAGRGLRRRGRGARPTPRWRRRLSGSSVRFRGRIEGTGCGPNGQGRRWCFPRRRGRRERASGWIDSSVAAPVEGNCFFIIFPRITAVSHRVRLGNRLQLVRGRSWASDRLRFREHPDVRAGKKRKQLKAKSTSRASRDVWTIHGIAGDPARKPTVRTLNDHEDRPGLPESWSLHAMLKSTVKLVQLIIAMFAKSSKSTAA